MPNAMKAFYSIRCAQEEMCAIHFRLDMYARWLKDVACKLLFVPTQINSRFSPFECGPNRKYAVRYKFKWKGNATKLIKISQAQHLFWMTGTAGWQNGGFYWCEWTQNTKPLHMTCIRADTTGWSVDHIYAINSVVWLNHYEVLE